MAGKPNLKKKLDVVFSLFIRLRDARKDGTFKCISCGQIKSFDQADCGHYINRQHMSTRYIQGYRRGLFEKYGVTTVILLESMKNQVNKISEFEYKAMIAYYKKEIKRLKQEKQID